jgi:hypothetical protein
MRVWLLVVYTGAVLLGAALYHQIFNVPFDAHTFFGIVFSQVLPVIAFFGTSEFLDDPPESINEQKMIELAEGPLWTDSLDEDYDCSVEKAMSETAWIRIAALARLYRLKEAISRKRRVPL